MDPTPGAPASVAFESRAAFRELLDALREIEEKWIGDERGFGGERTPLALRSLGMVLWGALEFYLEADLERPHFSPIVHPWRKWSDNPDARYYVAPLRGDRGGFRVRGRRTGEVYLNLTLHRGDREGHWASGVAADLNLRDLHCSADGRFEVVLAAERPAGHAGDWMPMPVDAGSLLVRYYYENPTPAASDPSIDPQLSIEPLVPPPAPPAPPSDAEVAARLRRVANWLRSKGGGQIFPASRPRLDWYAEQPNALGEPVVWTEQEGGGWGAVDVAYAAGDYALGPHEALVMEGRLPRGLFNNVVLWNPMGQTEDYRFRRVSYHQGQLEMDAERRYRIVVAHRDPGLPNWLDTAGHARGTIYWRFMLPDERPEAPTCRVVPFASVASRGA